MSEDDTRKTDPSLYYSDVSRIGGVLRVIRFPSLI